MMFHLVDYVGTTAATSITLIGAIAYGFIFTGLSCLACAGFVYGLIRGGHDE